MNYLDLFHGIGGFALGAYWAGMKFENHYCSDIEPYCQKLYAARFPDSIQLGDITKIDASTLPAGEWILTGGFPCQDISIAGKGAGIHGERSGLWFEYWRLIRDLRPRIAIMENVGMLVHRGLREVLGSLAEIGYDAEWQDIRASDVGAPHRRERIWIVAYLEQYGTIRKTNTGESIIFNEMGSRVQEEWNSNLAHAGLPESPGRDEIKESGERETCCQFAPCRDVADSPIPGLQGQEPTRGGPGESGLSAERGDEFSNAASIRELQSQGREQNERERIGNSSWWSTEPDVGRLAHGIPHRVDRLKGLGNAIVPQIAELLFRQIKGAL